MTRSRLSPTHLLWRHATAGVGASITVMVVVFVVAALAVGTPRAVQNLVTASVRHEVGALPVTARDLVATEFGGPSVAPSRDAGTSPFDARTDAVWGGLEDGIADLRASMPPVLENSLGEATYATTLVPNRARADWPGAPDSHISLGFDPRILDRVTIVSGEAPGAIEQPTPSAGPVQLMLSETNAVRMEWELGEVRSLLTPDGTQPLQLAATFEPNEPDDPYWIHIPASLTPSIEVVGLAPPVIIGVGYADAASWEQIVPLSAGAQTRAWFPVDADTLTAANAAGFATGVREFTRAKQPVSTLDDPGWFGRYSLLPVTGLAFSTRVTNALDDAIAATSATTAVLAMTASGPGGVIVAVMLLGSGLIASRRAPGLALAAARGASTRQLRAALATEGLTLGLPAAAAGAIVGAVLVPGEFNPAELVLPASVALLPTILMAAVPVPTGLRRSRSDLTMAPNRQWRWVLELVALGLASLAVFLLLRRGVGADSATVSVDPLLAAVPLLLSLAACVLVLRLYPVPLAALLARARRRRGLVAYLGAARGLRDPGAGLAPVLATVVGVSVAVFSATMLSTISTGVERAAQDAVGADVLVSSQAITADQAAAVAELPGVAATAPVYAEVRVTLTHDGQRDYVTVIVIDADELAAVQEQPLEGLELLQEDGGSIPVIASQDVADTVEGSSDIEINSAAVDLVAVAPSDGPLSNRRAWVVVDRDNAFDLVGTIYSPARIFIDLEDGTDVVGVCDSIRSLMQSSAVITTPQGIEAQLRANPVVSGLQGALIVALLVISFLCTIAVLMTLARGRAARDRTLSVLRTLGLDRRPAAGLVVWELAPVTAVALIVGTALGLTLPLLVLAGVDLTRFTGGTVQPELVINPMLTAAVTGGFLVLVAAATAITVLTSRRVDPATTLRATEE